MEIERIVVKHVNIYKIKTELESEIPLSIKIWCKCSLSGNKGEFLFRILFVITLIMSNNG